MKKIHTDAIVNIPNTPVFDRTFLFEYLTDIRASQQVEIIFLRDLLEKKKNEEILAKVATKPAMWSEVYSPKDELEIFTELFEKALEEKKRIHIVGITLWEEVKMLEEYYESLGFMREDINAFEVDFSIPLVTASCHVENLIWRGSDYKAQKDAIFFNPPVRESGQNKAIFKGITRGVIAGIELGDFSGQTQEFIGNCVREEKILPLHMGKVLLYNLLDIGLTWTKKDLEISY